MSEENTVNTGAESPRNINDVVQAAMHAESQGIPVDWKSLCLNVLNAAQQALSSMEQQLAEHNSMPVDPSE